jgi:hypothetical protein
LPQAPVQAHLRRQLDAVLAEQEDRARLAMRDHDVSGLTARQLDRTRRDLHASLALVRPDSPARVPILAHLSAIDTELARRIADQPQGSQGSPLLPRSWRVWSAAVKKTPRCRQARWRKKGRYP